MTLEQAIDLLIKIFTGEKSIESARADAISLGLEVTETDSDKELEEHAKLPGGAEQ